jgi:hypothetical protein
VLLLRAQWKRCCVSIRPLPCDWCLCGVCECACIPQSLAVPCSFSAANNSLTGVVPSTLTSFGALALQPNCLTNCSYARQPWCAPCSGAVTSSPAPTPSATPTPSPSASHHVPHKALSTEATIGVGAGVGVALLVAAIGVGIWLHKRKVGSAHVHGDVQDFS